MSAGEGVSFAKNCLARGWRFWEVAQLRRGRVRRKVVLLMHRDWLARLILQEKVQQHGLKVEAVGDLGEAEARFLRRVPDGVLMEGVTGADEVVARFRTEADFGNRPVYRLRVGGDGSGWLAGLSTDADLLATGVDDLVARFVSEVGVGAESLTPGKPLRLGDAEAAALDNVPGMLRVMVLDMSRAWEGVERAGDAGARARSWGLLRQKARTLMHCAAVAGRSAMAQEAAQLAESGEGMAGEAMLDGEGARGRVSEVLQRLQSMANGVSAHPPHGPEGGSVQPVPEPAAAPTEDKTTEAKTLQMDMQATMMISPSGTSATVDDGAGSKTAAASPPADTVVQAGTVGPRDGFAALARATAGWERERAERRRSEERAANLAAQVQGLHEQLGRELEMERVQEQRIAELETRLRQADEELARARAEMEREQDERRLAEEELSAMDDLNRRWEANQQLVEETKELFRKSQEENEDRVRSGAAALRAAEERLKKEIQDRQRAEEALAGTELKLREQSEVYRAELGRMKAAREMEGLDRRRLEEEVLRLKCQTMDSRRGNQAMVNELRRQFGPPLRQLQEAICRLLQAGLSDEQTQVVQGALEQVLLLQTGFQELDGGAGTEGALATTGSVKGPDRHQPLTCAS